MYGGKVMILVITLTVAAALGNPAFAQERIVLEAENSTDLKEPLVVIDASKPGIAKVAQGSSGNKYLEIAQGKGKPADGGVPGQAVLTFTVKKAGTYTLWSRCFWQDGCGNSFLMQLDDQPTFIFGQDSTYDVWHWVKAPARLSQFKLSRGDHKLVIQNREDGVRIDQVVFVNDARYVPVDVEDPSP